MSRETKIGLFAIISIGLLIFGYKFLKGQNVFGSSQTFYVVYDNVNGLAVSTPVTVSGVQVGTVQDVVLRDDLKTALVTLDISGDVQVPEGTVVELKSAGPLGGMNVLMNFRGLNCAANPCAESEATLQGQYFGLIESMLSPADAEEYVQIATDGLSGVIDTLSEKFDEDSRVGQAFVQVEETLQNLNSATRQLNGLMANTRSDLQRTVRNIRMLTDTLANSNADIADIIQNAETMTAKLSRVDWEGTAGNANNAINNVNKTLETANAALADLGKLVTTATEGDGSMAAILNDKELYNNLTKVTDQFALLAADIRVHPERYRRILSKKTKTDPVTNIPEDGTPEKNERN